MVLLVRLLGLSGFTTALAAVFLLRPGPHEAEPHTRALMRYFGRFVFLTVQTNFINVVYFSIGLAASLTESPTLNAITGHMFPLAFALGALLTPLYYALDHFNPAHKERNKQHKELGFRYAEAADHLEHGFAFPLAILEACFLPTTPPTTAWTITLTSSYICIYLGITILNRYLTGLWTYPILGDAYQSGGYLGVSCVITIVSIFMSLLSLAGNVLPQSF